MADYTPKPWRIKRTFGTPEIHADGRFGSVRVAKLLYNAGSEDGPIVEANANLLVNAPEMHERLRTLMAASLAAVSFNDTSYLTKDLLDSVRSTLDNVEVRHA